MARLRKYASRDRLGDLQVIDKAAFVDPNVQNSHQNDDYPRWQMGGMRDSGARYPTHGSEIVKVDPAGAEHQRCSD